MTRITGLALALLLAAGCSQQTPAPTGCSTNNDCLAGSAHVCLQRACVVCATDGDCGQGKKCDSNTACVQCLASTDCQKGTFCQNKQCVVGCDTTAQCPGGQVCDTDTRSCVACLADKDCPTATPKCNLLSHSCAGCLVDNDCMAGQVCMGNACAQGCSGSHPACPQGQVCNVSAGACVQCLSDGDCAKNTSSPRCNVATFQCVQCLPANDNCPAGTYCAQDTCTPGCRSDADCASQGGGQCDTTAHQCFPCVTNSGCGLGQVCANHACAAGCTAEHNCPAGQGCCAGACITVASDVNNCGACGVKCASGQGCCGGTCVSLDTVANCGACGQACGASSDCCSGTCTNIHTKTNCGACGMACGANSDCCNGFTCAPTNTVNSCGSCGYVCPALANATTTCDTTTAKCTIGTCNTGFADCDKNPANGCEVNLNTDANNCGACNTVCPNSGSCMMGSCNPFIGSTLITGTQGAQINTWVGASGQQWSLCYRLSRDGSATSTFHSKCDGRGPTVTIMKLNNGAQLVGGFTTTSWDSNGCHYAYDTSAFIFSLTNSFKHSQPGNYGNYPQYAIYTCNSYGPSFGGGWDLSSGGGNGTMGNGAYCNTGYSYTCRVGGYSGGPGQCGNDLCGSYNPIVTDLEVFVQQGH